ncbi:MAG: aminopeptidase P N-terminal domain-containing protein [Gemmatimonadetes bacterium]|nr:aminopeptidase P N-terminal domain-containing protein [Gemmatimonadota bacterium]
MSVHAEPGHHAARRARLLDLLGEHAALILPAAPELRVGRDLELRYRADPELYYLTGITEPEAVAVLCPSHEDARFVLFVRPRDPQQEVWTGARGGPEAAQEHFGADAAYPVTELTERLPKIVQKADTLYFRLGAGREQVEALVRRIIVDGKKLKQRSGRGPRVLADPGLVLDDLRLIKDAHELEQIEAAARVTAEGFREVLPLVGAGAGEWELEAALDAAFRRRGADGTAFPTIVASGANATVLHYVENARRMNAGELVLIDAGAAVGLYNGDISRTFPVSGRYTPAQRTLYEVVLAARDAAIAAIRPGTLFQDVHGAALRTLVEGLVRQKLLDGPVDELVEKEEAYRRFLPHRSSHWLGLEVHDVGDYTVREQPRRLEPGMALTVEPGLYVPLADPPDAAQAPGYRNVPDELRGIGIRIEDDVVVTQSGNRVLTGHLPAAAEEIEW